jgi:hypothetical protein
MQIKSFAHWILAISVASLAACGGDDGGGKDAPPAAELTCASYCSSINANCTTTNSQFQGMTDCMASCTHYPLGALSDMSGNTLGCRIYHAGAAASGPDVHCRHAGPGGNTACGDNCLGFCTLVLGSCTGAYMQYNGDMSQCMTACAAFPTTTPYSSTVTSGNTFACRLYHATQAAVMADPHCVHAGTTDTTMTPCK